MRNMVILAVVALAAAALAPRADAAASPWTIQPGTLELYPTLTAVGIEIPYQGDDDMSASATFVWRKAGEDQWRNGVDMTIDRRRKLIWASIWPLEQGQTVEVKVTFRDDGGRRGTAGSLEGSVTTRTLPVEVEGGSTFWVSPAGDDANAGTQEAPFRTIARASQAVKAGDVVYAMTGVYREGNLLKGLRGTPDKPIVVAAAPGEKPVLDGSVTIERGATGWTDLGGGVYAFDIRFHEGDSGYVAQDGLRMFKYRALAELRADTLATKRNWHYDGSSRLYVTTGDATTPAEHEYSISTFDYGAHFSRSHNVVLRGFEVRYYGVAGIGVTDGSTRCAIVDNAIYNVPGAVHIYGEDIVDTVVWRNNMYEKGLTDFSWNAIKASAYRRQGLTCFSGRGTSICYNRVEGFFDCVDPETWRRPEDIHLDRDLDVMFNHLIGCGDDAIEADGGGVNMRIHGNVIRDAFAAISLAPAERGPLYVTNNDCTYFILMFKLNVGGCTSLGWTYVYQNSAYCLTNGRQYGGTAMSFAPGDSLETYNKVFKNNAFICDGLAIRNGHEGNWFDYNCYWPVPGSQAMQFRWERVDQPSGKWSAVGYEDIRTFSAATGREVNGMTADPQFAATPGLGQFDRVDFGPNPFALYLQERAAAGADLRLQPTSPCIDAGQIIRGINEDFSGKAPDIGAHESHP